MMKKINDDGLTPETPETPETGFPESYSRNSRNTLGFGSFGSAPFSEPENRLWNHHQKHDRKTQQKTPWTQR